MYNRKQKIEAIRVKHDICCKCGRKLPVTAMSLIGYEVYACHKCLVN